MVSVRPAHRHAPKPRPHWLRSLITVGLITAAVLVAGGIGMEQIFSQNYRLPLVVGAVPYWDAASATASVATHSNVVDTVTPWAYGVAPDGSIQSQPLSGQAAERDLFNHPAVGGARLIPSVGNITNGAWAPSIVRAILHKPARRAAHIRALVDLAVQHGFSGLQIDYEDLTSNDRAVFTSFIDELATALHAHGDVLWVTVHPKVTDAGYDERNRAQDYAALGRSADKVVVMAYDWHWANSGPGPIAPTWWASDVVAYAISQIPAGKIVLGVGLYGYDWVGNSGTPIVWQQVKALTAQLGVEPQRDKASGSPMFRYTTDGQVHEVWFEDAESITAKLDLAVHFRLGGVELWRMGSEDPAMWKPLVDRSVVT